MDKAQIETILVRNPWFGDLPAELRALILSEAHARRIRSGAMVYALGDACDGAYAVLQGEIRLIGHPEPGRQLVYYVCVPGSWFGEVSVFDGEPRFHNAVAVGEVVVLHLPTRGFDAIIARDPRYYRHFALLLCQHLRTALHYIGDALTQPLKVRLARTLLALRDTHCGVAASNEICSHLSQEDLASMVGVSRQSLNKALRELERAGIIRIGYSRLDVLDLGRLSALATSEEQ